MINIGAAIIFAVAVLHTFSVKFFERMADKYPRHAGVFELLSEVEVVFGFWAMVLIAFLAVASTPDQALAYLNGRNFTEPMFVFVIMVVAASKPVINLATIMVDGLARLLPFPIAVSTFFVTLFLVPLFGSFITEPAAMTLAALLLRDRFYALGLSNRLKYATVGVLFVNVSIGGTLTSFAAPPVLMVAHTWDWDTAFMLTHIGWKAMAAVFINAAGVTWLFRHELASLFTVSVAEWVRIPKSLTIVHLLFLAGIVVFAHDAVVFVGLFLLFMGVVMAYPQHQDTLMMRSSMMVAFFLAGLVVLGGQQEWWLKELLASISSTAVYYGAAALTAITDNAALTYLGSLVPGLSDEFKYSLVTGAVTGGGLTVIANAPNPAGYSILKGKFEDGQIGALGIITAAIIPTFVAILAFRLF